LESAFLPSVFREHDRTAENERVIQFAESRNGVFPFAVLDEDNIPFLEEHCRQIAGVKEHIILHETVLTPAKKEIFALMRDNNLTLVLHSGAKNRETYIRSVLDNFPGMKIQVAHMSRDGTGAPAFIYDSLRSLARFESVFFDTSTTRLPEIVERAVGIVGSERILYGSDFPFFMDKNGSEDIIDEQVGQILRARITDDVRERIFRKNFDTYITKSGGQPAL
jgi:predicted TIM-barrel fold metal-dependent hydrolase